MRPRDRFFGRWPGCLVALALAASLLSGACGAVLDDGGNSDREPDLVVAARTTLTAREVQRELTPTRTPRAAVEPATPTSAGVAMTCPADDVIDGAPPGNPSSGPGNHRWYGSAASGLWASPVDVGIFLPEGFGESDSLWYAGEITSVLWFGVSQSIEVFGERLDGDATMESVQLTEAQFGNWWTDIVIPEPGCWQLTGTSEGRSLTITVEALPSDLRPDFRMIQTLYDARPYDPPSTCPVTSWVGPETREGVGFAHFWLEAGDIYADVFGWFVAGEQQSMGVYGVDVVSALDAKIRRLDPGPSTEIDITTVQLNSEGRIARFIFPEPGCWELEFVTPASTATFTLYVYPAECAPVQQVGQYLVSCEEP